LADSEQGWRAALCKVAAALASANDPWWIIGSAAVALHGADPGEVGDLDVIVSVRDIEALHALGNLTFVDERSRDHFNSEKFGRCTIGDVEVEFFANLKVSAAGKWHLVSFDHADIIRCEGEDIRVPKRKDLIDLLELFGRDKDLRRAAALRNI